MINQIKKINRFLSSVINEITKCRWASKKEVYSYTVQTIIITLISAFILLSFDFIIQKLMNFIGIKI